LLRFSDVLIAVVDGRKGFPEAITAVFPQTMVQTCIVHLLRHSLDFVSWKDRKLVAAALKDIYRAVDAEAGEAALGAFEESPWGQKYPAIGREHVRQCMAISASSQRVCCCRANALDHFQRDTIDIVAISVHARIRMANA
jgi:transposase-like protein